MTEKLRESLIENMGTSTGPTKYNQLKELLKILQVIPNKRTSRIPSEAVNIMLNWTDEEWNSAVQRYRQETSAMVKLNVSSLPRIRQSIEDSLR